MKQTMKKIGVREDKIHVNGIPIKETFYKVYDKIEMKSNIFNPLPDQEEIAYKDSSLKICEKVLKDLESVKEVACQWN